MKKESIMVGVIGLLVGVLVAGFAAGQAVNTNNSGMMRMMGMEIGSSHETMSMADMTKQLTDKTGDNFDQAFIEMMISHHEGAVAMAELIPSRAKHDEIKTLGKAVIEAQTKEIADMKQWQKDWGYAPNEVLKKMHSH